MAIVAHGLGQPESGAIVAGGLGAAETDPNALRAHLSGSSSVLAVLSDGSAPVAPPSTGGRTPYYYYTPPHPVEPQPIPGRLVAHLHGDSRLHAHLDFTLDPDWLAAELATALLLDLV